MFVAIGHAPATELVRGQLALKPNGYVLTDARARPRPASKACSPPATSPTTSSARPSPPPASAAWRRWRPNAGSPRRRRRAKRRSNRRETCYTELELANSPSRSPRRGPQAKPAAAMAGGAGEEAMDWDKLRIFQAAAEAGSFTHAGETLGLSQSAVSRQVSALEQDLGAPLFHRHARGLILTEQGEMLLEAVQDVVLKLDAVRSRLIDTREKPHGELARHHHAGAGRQLAGAAARRIRRALPGSQAAAAAVRRRARLEHARSRRRAAPARADAARPHPPAAVHRAFSRLCLGRLSQEKRPAAHDRRSRPPSPGRFRRADRDALALRSQFAADGRARSEKPARAPYRDQQPRRDHPRRRARRRHRGAARLLRDCPIPASCGCCPRPTCRRWTASSSTPRK